ncbi:MAG: NAD(P)-dependent oxidoreductase [Marinilabiliales bacterium]|nr:MAG: NAD(P)-dependent oxidoreductase [Marinilabiliales bacterium]
MNKTIFISGATSGIGKSCAFYFAKDKNHLILTGRREERLLQLQKELIEEHDIEVLILPFDIRNRDEVNEAVNSLPQEWKDIDVLINNAGLASGLSTIQDGDIEDWEKMIDTNLKGLLYLSRAIMPLMIERKKGHIINIGSIAGKEVYPNGNVYCSTKHAVDALTKAMRIDLLPHMIKVTQIAPGAVETEFSIVRFHGDEEKAGKVYDGYTPLTPNDIADAVYYVANLPEHVNINDLLIMPTAQASSGHFNKNI